MNCQRCGVSLHGCGAWAPCYACGAAQYADFHDVDALSMQRMYNRLQSQQNDLIRLGATPPKPKAGVKPSLSFRDALPRMEDWHDDTIVATFKDGTYLTVGALRRVREAPDEPVDDGHRWGCGSLVCNCGERRKRGASHLAPPGWPGNPSNERCCPALS